MNGRLYDPVLGRFLCPDNYVQMPEGSFILGNKNTVADATNATFQHEYGHYLQSQTMGWGYMFKVAIPSFVSAAVKKSENHKYRSFERDANNRAFKYFNKYVKGFYVSKDEYPHNSHGWNFIKNPLVDKTEREKYVNYYDL